MTQRSESEGESKLIRAIGRWSVAAMVINGIIGSGVFALPAVVAKLLGPISPIAYIAAALLMFTIILCFAEAASLFPVTGGPYVYARESMGKLVGFEIGWISYLVPVTSVAANYAVFLDYLTYFWSGASHIPNRTVVLTLLVLFQATTNIAGVRQGTWLINTFTIAKLLPLLILILVGLFHLKPSAFAGAGTPNYHDTTRAVLLLVFAYGGFEQTTFVAGEMRNPRTDLPRALILALLVVTLVYVSIQVICTSTLPELQTETRPLAAAALSMMGRVGAVMIGAGALLSTFGHTSGSMLQSPRMTFALAEGGQLPRILSAVLSKRRTPYVSILLFAFIVWALTVWGTFVQLAALSALARVCTYITTALAVLMFRRTRRSEATERTGEAVSRGVQEPGNGRTGEPESRRTREAGRRGSGGPDGEGRFRAPAGPVVPVIAIACSCWLLSNATKSEVISGGVALLIGAILSAWGRIGKPRTGEPV